jgi:OOP family OmpA-OmpF porin
MHKETILKKAVVVAGVIVSMSGTLLAGGTKMVSPVDAKVAPVAEVISPIALYVGVGLVASSTKRDPCPCDPDSSDLKDLRYGTFIRGGYDFNNYFGIEGRAFKTLGSDTFSKVTHYGLYAKPQYHLTDALNIYGLIGYGRTIVDYTNGIQSSHNTKNAFSYGAGIE